MGSSKQAKAAALALLCAAVALLAVAAAAAAAPPTTAKNQTAWRRVEDYLAAEWELPVDTAGELLYASAIRPGGGSLIHDQPSCSGGGCAANGGGGYHDRGCIKRYGCHD